MADVTLQEALDALFKLVNREVPTGDDVALMIIRCDGTDETTAETMKMADALRVAQRTAVEILKRADYKPTPKPEVFEAGQYQIKNSLGYEVGTITMDELMAGSHPVRVYAARVGAKGDTLINAGWSATRLVGKID